VNYGIADQSVLLVNFSEKFFLNMSNTTNNIPSQEETGFPLTKKFLELAFDREVEKFSVNVGTNPGDNYKSIMHAIELTFKGEKESYHYLIKCYPNNQGRRDFLDQTDIFSKELFMYQEFLPQLKQLAVDCGAENIVDLSLAPFHGGNVAGIQCKYALQSLQSCHSFFTNKLVNFIFSLQQTGSNHGQMKISF